MDELKQLQKLTNKMVNLADRIDLKKQPYRMNVLSGLVRDSAYAIRKSSQEIIDRGVLA